MARLYVLQTNCSRLQLKSIVPIVGDLRDSSWVQDAAAKAVKRPIASGSIDSCRCPMQRSRRIATASGCEMAKGAESVRTAITAAIANTRLGGSMLAGPAGCWSIVPVQPKPKENEDVIDGFLRSHAEFRRESVAPWLPEPGRQFLTARRRFLHDGKRGFDGRLLCCPLDHDGS